MWRWLKKTIFKIANFFPGIFRHLFASEQQRVERQPLLQEDVTRTSPQQDRIESADEQNNDSQPIPRQLTNFLSILPDEILLRISDCLPLVKDKAHSALVSRYYYNFFQPEVEKQAAKEAAAYAINPTKENVERLKKLLKNCPALLKHPMTVKNRHGKVIKGAVYQIALHEADNELIDDVIKPVFEQLQNGLSTMEEQRKEWLPEGWMEAEEKACASALTAIDQVFAAFKAASNPHDVTELSQYPYTITINNQGVNEALEVFRKVVDALYEPPNTVIESGRDPIIRLLERVVDRYTENYTALGGFNTPPNNALMRMVFGYCQRFAPINFMQAFAQGVYYIVEDKEKLTRTFEYRNWKGHFILPLDSDLLWRLGCEYFAAGLGSLGATRCAAGAGSYKTFCQSKTAAILQSYHASPGRVLHNNVD